MRIGPVVNNQRHQLKVCGNCFNQIYASKENIKHSDDDDDDFDDNTFENGYYYCCLNIIIK